MANFASAVTGWALKVTAQLEERFQETALTGYSILKRRSPVDTGNYRSNWRAGLNSPNLLDDEESFTLSKFGDEPNQNELKDAKRVIRKAKLKDVVYLTNNRPFAGKIERGLSTTMAPQGVLRLSYEELKLRFPSLGRFRARE